MGGLSPAQQRARRFRNAPRPTAPANIDASVGRRDTTQDGEHPYAVGYKYETAVRGILERRGWYTIRSYGSKGVIDVFAWKLGHPALFIQAKVAGDIGGREWNAVYELAMKHGGIPVVAYRVAKADHAFMRLDGPRVFRGRGRPWTRLDPATLAEMPLQLDLAA